MLEQIRTNQNETGAPHSQSTLAGCSVTKGGPRRVRLRRRQHKHTERDRPTRSGSWPFRLICHDRPTWKPGPSPGSLGRTSDGRDAWRVRCRSPRHGRPNGVQVQGRMGEGKGESDQTGAVGRAWESAARLQTGQVIAAKVASSTWICEPRRTDMESWREKNGHSRNPVDSDQ